MNRQKTIGRKPSARSVATIVLAVWSLLSFLPCNASAWRAISNRRRRWRVSSPSCCPESAPGVMSTASTAASSSRSRTVRRPRSSASSGVSVSTVAARVRSVAAAAAGLEARARNNARADHHWTRWRCLAPSFHGRFLSHIPKLARRAAGNRREACSLLPSPRVPETECRTSGNDECLLGGVAPDGRPGAGEHSPVACR